MRPTCLECAGKHLAQACVLLKETKTGYPAFKWFVIGHLAEAEEETVATYPDLANEIREHRVAWTDNDETVIPFEELFARIDDLIDSDKEPDVELPEGLSAMTMEMTSVESVKEDAREFSTARTMPMQAATPDGEAGQGEAKGDLEVPGAAPEDVT